MATMDPKMVEQGVKDICEHTASLLKKRMIESNKLRGEATKVVTLDRVHRVIFQQILFTDVAAKGISTKQIETLDKVVELFGQESVVRVYSSGDISLVAPWMKLVKDLDDKEFVKGKLLLPLEYSDGEYTCFVPYGGPDPLYKNPPSWPEVIPLAKLVPEFVPKKRRKRDEKETPVPVVMGLIRKFASSDVERYESVKVTYKPGKYNVGDVEITHRNAVFNGSYGYYVHETYV